VGSGKILSFDDIRGYGFIVPDDGGSDVFVHANELRDEKAMFRPGTPVEFDVVDSGRGPKAYAVRVLPGGVPGAQPGPPAAEGVEPVAALDPDGAAPPPAPAPPAEPGTVLPSSRYSRELTELFLEALPELTGAQIVRLRTSLLATARRHGWIDG
jgi:cold shock CspA family protein